MIVEISKSSKNNIKKNMMLVLMVKRLLVLEILNIKTIPHIKIMIESKDT